MSSFNGRVIELPGVIVDHFVSSNVKEGRFFFLSHCHKGGLTQSQCQQQSVTTVCCLLCHEYSASQASLLLFQLHALAIVHVGFFVFTAKWLVGMIGILLGAKL